MYRQAGRQSLGRLAAKSRDRVQTDEVLVGKAATVAPPDCMRRERELAEPTTRLSLSRVALTAEPVAYWAMIILAW